MIEKKNIQEVKSTPQKLKFNMKNVYEGYFNTEIISSFSDMSEILNIANREILITDIDEDTGNGIDNIISFFNKMDDDYEIEKENRLPIKVMIDSNGGSLTSAFTIFDSIKFSKTPVYTINLGKAYSAGFLVYCAGHKRYSYPSSSFLFHEGSIRTGGNANKFDDCAAFYKKQRGLLKEMILGCSDKVTEEEYDEHRKDDWWFDAAEAVEKGFCHEIGKPE